MNLSDTKGWPIKLQNQDGRSYSSVHTIRSVHRPAFQMVVVELHGENYYQHFVENYNKIYKVQKPNVAFHVWRHNYCSYCVSSNRNPKHLMGDSDIIITLKTYIHIDFDNAKKEAKRLEKAVL